MLTSTKIEFRHRQISQLDDITDLLAILFPGNRNQQYAAARILIELKAATELVPALTHLERRQGISRRTLQRARAKLARLGLIERVSRFNSRYAGQEGWKLSGRMSTGLRHLANKIDDWRKDGSPERREKDERLAELLR